MATPHGTTRRDPQWQRVHDGLAALPVQDDSYVLHEDVENMWTEKNYEHPALIGAFGWLPGDGVDIPTMERTADRVFTGWRFSRTWGWDFPMLAMCAARIGRPDDAVGFLLTRPVASSSTTPASRPAGRSPTSRATAPCSTPSHS